MARRQHKAVAVGPAGIGGVEFEEAGEQHGGHVGHAQGQAGMAGFGGLHRVHRQDPDGVGEAADMGLVGRSWSGAVMGVSRRVVVGLSERLAPPSRPPAVTITRVG